jgi:PadR family transcriptional regulator, regulatory protein AphA
MSRATDSELTSTGAIILGLIRMLGPSTPYRLKRVADRSVGDFWPLPHAQLYAEPERLAEAGLLEVEREEGGRRRKIYSLTPAGEAALEAWIADAEAAPPQFRIEGVLKLFFGADPSAIAPGQLKHHRRWIEILEETQQLDLAPGAATARDQGLRIHRVFADLWEEYEGR